MANQTYSKEVLQQQVNVLNLKEAPSLLLKKCDVFAFLFTYMDERQHLDLR
ncbi:hypothetical protein JCM19055_1496 [Geomicrobium sp. JCM 19055]|nr:hypothetical protein JCM19055_1496 [Geomicrobium sp. JCM 19055]